MTTENKTKPIRHPGQFGNHPCAPTKEEQLEEFSKYIYDDIKAYWDQWHLPLPWHRTRYQLRRMRCPLATPDEVRSYTTQRYLREIRDLTNKIVYVPHGVVETKEAEAKLIWQYHNTKDQMRTAKKGY